ncbi:conserved hypothetical protein [Staphylococcus aureus subsp. aureus str. Newman]|uniref:Uncharacterized protein n=1 Tax=Staphylococcus aureus (strain Newman) TaxID=426430 RepID=A0A0H3KEM2_STAAE|nr:hypothetical protein SAD30_0118 [Staphylococcus aureus D30]EFK83069.1 hypothetical protein HMPREF0773_10553 [Staphylococcus aureus subsp. aureus TCH70]BAB96088.1 hypothetical protein [Staphylococcus aureus subsp. aureus MW2]BAF68476.1 conserved hypothetical protein [Staphylococcus aureus subsp. aureus str. Newman]CAG44006.1 putative membrane protein [Staphylococcus aureus subsp. aureus MSSA476]
MLFFVATYLFIFPPIFKILIFSNTINFKTTLSNLIDPVFPHYNIHSSTVPKLYHLHQKYALTSLIHKTS